MEASLLDAAFSQESHRATEAWRGLGGYIHHNHPPAVSTYLESASIRMCKVHGSSLHCAFRSFLAKRIRVRMV